MLVAYLDEFGHVGPYISPEHKKFFHHPLFGYAGIVLPEQSVRAFGARFEHRKARMFRHDIIRDGKHPRRWEKKGSELYTSGAQLRYPERNLQIADLGTYLSRLNGKFFFYGELKPVGSIKETGQTPAETTRTALVGAVRRLCAYADGQGQDLLVLLDRGGPMPREEAITAMASFIYSSPDPAMKRILEVPMELESHRYGAMQFADWTCAILSRASHFHFTNSDEFAWSPAVLQSLLYGRTVRDSRIWLPAASRRITLKTLVHANKWINSDSHLGNKAHSRLTHTVADAVSFEQLPAQP